MKVAVLTTPNNKSVPHGLVRLIESFDRVYALEDFGGRVFSNACKNIDVLPTSSVQSYVQKLDQNVKILLEMNVELIICLGGDGLSCYVASSLILNCPKKKPLMIGWAGGTANVGPIVRNTCSDKIEDYREDTFDALEVMDNGRILGYAFNDLIIGNSFLGTLDGNVVNLDARAMIEESKKVVCIPQEKILSDDYAVYLNGEKLDKVPFPVKQICISTLKNENLYGRAVLGGLGQAMGMNHPAGAAFMDRIAVDSRPETWSYKGFVNTAHICFESSDLLELEGFTKDGQILIDGNPFIRKDNKIRVRCIPDAITVLRSDL